jgi:hypothetical protein
LVLGHQQYAHKTFLTGLTGFTRFTKMEDVISNGQAAL